MDGHSKTGVIRTHNSSLSGAERPNLAPKLSCLGGAFQQAHVHMTNMTDFWHSHHMLSSTPASQALSSQPAYTLSIFLMRRATVQNKRPKHIYKERKMTLTGRCG